MMKLVQSRKVGLVKVSVKVFPHISSHREVQETSVNLLSNAVEQPRFQHTIDSTPNLVVRISDSSGLGIYPSTNPSLFLASRLVVIVTIQVP